LITHPQQVGQVEVAVALAHKPTGQPCSKVRCHRGLQVKARQPQGQRRKIEEGQLQRLLELPGPLAPQQHPRDVGFNQPHRARATRLQHGLEGQHTLMSKHQGRR
jgi:hypothetical protein